MANKRTTLVRNFNKIVETGDMVAFQAVFKKCDVNAIDGGKGTALHFYSLTDEMIRWLIENGADLEAKNIWNKTPLHTMACLRGKSIDIFIELGANVNAVDSSGNTPLHYAAGFGFHAQNVKLLLDSGADPLAKNDYGQTPLEYALTQAANMDIAELAKIAQLLLASQPEITEEMRQNITKIGEKFEFYRAEYNPEFLPKASSALDELYSLFGVTPVARRKVFDGVSPIEVNATTWQTQFSELWDLLVPAKGAASTVQGEVIRICGKVSREILDNGAVNWSKEYKKLPQALPEYCAMSNQLVSSDFIELERLAKGIGANSHEDELNRLSELVVKWVMQNRSPISLTKVAYSR